ncbi:MAG: Hsp20/alpha crystallin family protein [Deltaproteobacteria bacterium]|nr:Hsp20/alpha crystallin family protein [Deltaproteobacteria bacterium]
MFALTPILRRSGLAARPTKSVFDRFMEEMGLPDLWLEEDEKSWIPALDVTETEKEIKVSAEVPGIAREDIAVSLTEGLLTVSGEKKEEKEEKSEGRTVSERCYGSFSRTVRLPAEVDAEKVEASYKDGVLTISLPKSESVKTTKITVKS